MFRPMDQVPAGCMCNIPALMPGLCIWASQIKAVTYILYHQCVGFLLQSLDFFLQSQTVDIEDRFPQCPLFLALCDLF